MSDDIAQEYWFKDIPLENRNIDKYVLNSIFWTSELCYIYINYMTIKMGPKHNLTTSIISIIKALFSNRGVKLEIRNNNDPRLKVAWKIWYYTNEFMSLYENHKDIELLNFILDGRSSNEFDNFIRNSTFARNEDDNDSDNNDREIIFITVDEQNKRSSSNNNSFGFNSFETLYSFHIMNSVNKIFFK